jgi:cell division septal protein FtsQ
MIDLHKAIRAIHNSAVSINGNTQETITATDNNGNNVTINWTSVNAWTDPDEYKYKRIEEYPSMAEQLDDIYHNGIDAWKATIKTTKDKYPK